MEAQRSAEVNGPARNRFRPTILWRMDVPQPVVNMADVAQRAGVGMATVSRALSGAYGVSDTTRRRIRDIAEEMGYVVHPEASRLARGGTGRVAVLLPHASRWFFGAVIEGIERELRRADVDVLLYQVPDADGRHGFFRDLPTRRKVDAVIVVGMPVDDDERRALEALQVQVVSVSGQLTTFPFVRIDDIEASRQAAAHLLSLGHRRIAMIEAVPPSIPEWFIDIGRSDGFRATLAAAGAPLDPALTVRIPWDIEAAALAMGGLLSLPEPPTAVFAHSDELALAAIRTIRRAGLRVPEDISVIGIDDHPLAALTDLTTIAQPAAHQGATAARMTLALLAGEPVDRAVTVPTMLVPRRSTAAPK
ncbi:MULTISPECIES: LacI family DNA-binding transcriptional regulator [unclassified Microbacterium]|uniref:LacI family DNA-binding transcriptional regulator n=1 Tax=unclassified Microbacterium TaxID=2609290 RepID=UPI00214B8593|nr:MULTISPECIES: LacI family DNA-binding transcriptional regulator [unclassified Microbacterium]MCR2784184.1 LacI family transcriptional regulator [Microbacterium sp. zg.B96]WIM14983.1 LacI family DNA-binding transcriptional regulator [Microbacterium sp. zg-B96]